MPGLTLSYMFDRFSKMPRFLNVPWFWIWRGCICKGYTVLNMPEYGSICPNNAWICLDVPQYAWILLNVPEYAWISCSISGFSICLIILDIWQGFEYAAGIKHPRVLNVLRYSYNDIIIIVTKVIVLEFLSARFVHPGAPKLTIILF